MSGLNQKLETSSFRCLARKATCVTSPKTKTLTASSRNSGGTRRQITHRGAFGGLRSGRRTQGRFRQYDARRLPHCARRKRLLFDRSLARRGAVDGEDGSLDHHHDLVTAPLKLFHHYNVMGSGESGARMLLCVILLERFWEKKKIRVNAISAGPIKTLAARGISGLGRQCSDRTPNAHHSGRNVEVAREVGHPRGVFSGLRCPAAASPEKWIYVDCGYNIMGF